MTYPEILAAVLGVLGVPLAALVAGVVWDGRRDDHRAPRRPRPPGGRGTWAWRRAHWVARCQAQAILTTAHARAWGIRARAAVQVWGFRARGKGWQWRARRAARGEDVNFPPAPVHEGEAFLVADEDVTFPLAPGEPSRLATPGERSSAGLPTRGPS